jgi:hypothetical protein
VGSISADQATYTLADLLEDANMLAEERGTQPTTRLRLSKRPSNTAEKWINQRWIVEWSMLMPRSAFMSRRL